ncbi:MAG: hypothetical protein VXW87_00055 [Pseudomonadota bacterium]|nr:hypothetical protein [Pseudomonadota bacterium]
MIKEAIIFLLLVILVILVYALKDLFTGNKEKLDRSFQLRVGLSVILIVFIVMAYSLDLVQVAQTVRYL